MALYNGLLTTIDESELIRYAGLQRAKDFPESLIKDVVREIKLLAEPRGVYRSYNYDAENGCIEADPPMVLEGASIRKHLAQSVKVYVMSVTVGEAVEERSAAFFKENAYTKGVLLDAAATTAVEQIADQVNALIEREAKKQGYRTVWRFSPGYGDWPVEAQPRLAELIGTEEIGVSVTDSCMLFPRKSVTAIIGCIPKDAPKPAVETKRGCSSCTQKNCPSRKMPSKQ